MWPSRPERLSPSKTRKMRLDQLLVERGLVATRSRAQAVLLAGQVDVSRRDYLGQPQHLATLGPPSLVGHMGLVDQQPRSATCTALGATTLAVLPQQDFHRVHADPGPQGDVLRRLLISSMALQLARGNAELHRLVSGHDVELDPETQDVALAELVRTEATFAGWRP